MSSLIKSNSNTNKETNSESRSTLTNNLLNVELMFEFIFEKFSKGLRIIGPMFAFALTIFVLIVAHSEFYIVIPYWTVNFGILSGIILFFISLYLLFSILFNYFLSVLVRPGCLEDIKRSKYYRKNDPLNMKDDLVNLKDVFLNKINRTEKSCSNKSNNENKHIKLRLKTDNLSIVSDNLRKEEDILNNANLKNQTIESKLLNEVTDTVEENTDIFDEGTEIFKRHLESQLSVDADETTKDFTLELSKNIVQNNSSLNNENTHLENEKHIQEINSYYNINKSDTDEFLDKKDDFQHQIADCRHCKQPKPLRAHHCTICGYCVFKMDHHCPWINNCVGQNNHRYFILFLTHLMFGSLYVCLTAIPIIFNSDVRKTTEFNFVCTLSLVGFFLMIFFNGWNWFLVLRGNTTIEYWTLKADVNYNKTIKDFSLQTWRENIYLVFGTTSLFNAIFIPSIKKLPLSGLEWTKLAYPSFNFQIIEYERIEDIKIKEEIGNHNI